ncbi:MAG: PAS domain-containing sensor histidine kinase [Flavipsychrobacter sp.]|nr:PAS domain-containing sensor histidine kinase [Flavipsychrobacter sp.]
MPAEINVRKKSLQYLAGVLAVLAVAAVCFPFSDLIGYRVVAYVLLITVSLVAMVFDILPVLIAAVVSALVWDYFFIPPFFTFQVGTTEDRLMLLMYLVIAMVNAALTYKIRRAEKMAIQREEKENTIKLYNTMLNSLSHELRTPIATIVAATDNLQTEELHLTKAQNDELVGEIAKASFRLNRQVENLLNMSRLESGFIKPRNDWCDVAEVIYTAVQQVEENEVLQQIVINIDPELPLFRLDKGMLEQILYNLLVNATLYTPAGCRVDVMARCLADVLEVIVEDNGPGFPKDKEDRVFSKFYRLDNRTGGGTGLGLSIVKGFAEAMGGSARLERSATGGARFVLLLPAETSYVKNLKHE